MISVIIPIYNQADKLGSCLDSIAHQSYQDFEIIAINDGSRDNPKLVIEAFKKQFPSIKLVYIEQENKGSNPTRNRGWHEAGGEFLIFVDSDIEFESQAFEKMLVKLKSHPEASYVYPQHYFGAKLFALHEFDEVKLRQGPYIHTTALIRAKDFPGFDETIKRFQDWDLWLTMLEAGHKGVFLPEVLFKVKTGGTMSSWLPSFAYKLCPWSKRVQSYKTSMAIIKNKHHL